MKKALFLSAIYSLIASWPAFAADLPVKAVPPPVPIITTSPFWIGIEGGVGISPTENDFTIEGQSSGPIKGWPTGLLAGVSAGVSFNTGAFSLGAVISADYDFSRGCIDIACMAARKNGFLIQEGLEVGISMASVMGYVPGSAQPSHWLIPISVPSSLGANWIIVAEGGMAERNLDLCAVTGVIDPNGNEITACGSKFIAAPYAGIKNKFMISAQTELYFKWDHIFWGNQYSFTPEKAIQLFANSVTIKSEDIFKIGFAFHP